MSEEGDKEKMIPGGHETGKRTGTANFVRRLVGSFRLKNSKDKTEKIVALDHKISQLMKELEKRREEIDRYQKSEADLKNEIEAKSGDIENLKEKSTTSKCKLAASYGSVNFYNPVDPSHDVTFVMKNGEKIHANAQRLSGHSSVFLEMLSGDFTEKNQKEIEFEDIYQDDFISMLSIIHHPSTNITNCNAHVLIELGRRFKIDWIVDKCEKYWITYLLEYPTNETIILLLHTASKYDLVELQNHCLNQLKMIKDVEKVMNKSEANLNSQMSEMKNEFETKIENVKKQLAEEADKSKRESDEHLENLEAKVSQLTKELEESRGEIDLYKEKYRSWKKFAERYGVVDFKNPDDPSHDVTFVMKNGDKFQANMKLLSEHSSVFLKLFSDYLKEKNQKEIELKDVISWDFFKLLEQISHPSVKIEYYVHAVALITIGRRFKIDWIVDKCEKYLITDLTEDSSSQKISTYLLQACKYDLVELQNHSLNQLKTIKDVEVVKNVGRYWCHDFSDGFKAALEQKMKDLSH